MFIEPVTNETWLDDVGRNSAFMAVILAVVLGAASAQTGSGPASTTQTLMTTSAPRGFRAGHILVRFKTTPAQDVLNQLNTAFGAKAVGKIPEIGVTHLQVAGSGLELLHHLRNRPDVEFAEFDAPVQAIQTFLPDDIYYSTAYA